MRLTLFPLLILTALLLPLAAQSALQQNSAVHNMTQRMLTVISEMRAEAAPVETSSADQKQQTLASQLNDMDVGAGK